MSICSLTSRLSTRTQEFVVRSSDGGWFYRENVRQQYSFNPPDTMAEHEDYFLNLDGVTNLKLTIIPETQLWRNYAFVSCGQVGMSYWPRLRLQCSFYLIKSEYEENLRTASSRSDQSRN